MNDKRRSGAKGARIFWESAAPYLTLPYLSNLQIKLCMCIEMRRWAGNERDSGRGGMEKGKPVADLI